MKVAQSSSTSTSCGFPTSRSSPGNACRAVKFPKSRFPSSSPTWSSRSSAGATPPRRWRISSRNTSRKASAWSGTFGRRLGSSTSTRRPNDFTRLTASMRLDGGDVLPGFSVQVGELFEMPKRPGETRRTRRKTARNPGRRTGRGAVVDAVAALTAIRRESRTDHAHDADALSPGDFRHDR